jgi:phosphatidylglycerol:prolipoprotein diacylglycerol transferase
MKKGEDMKQKFSFLGMEFNTKKSIIYFSIFLAILFILIAIDLIFGVMNWYGFLIGMGFVIAIILASKLAKYRGLDEQFPFEIIYYVLPLSIIGARTYYVIFAGVQFFWDAFKIWEGGLAIYGGVIGGALGGIIYCLVKKRNILSTADVVAPVLILGQAIGRWGNFINKEVYGFVVANTNWQWFPFAVPIESGTGVVTWHLATFFYESCFDLLGFFVLSAILRHSKNKGVVACSYMIYYGTVRYFLEALRIPEYILYVPNTNLPVSQLVSLIAIFVGAVALVAILIISKKKQKQSEK